MDKEGVSKPGSDTQDSQEPGLQATSKLAEKHSIPIPLTQSPNALTTQGFKLKPSSKGVTNAKKILRAFSIQKKSAVIASKPGTPIKPAVSSGASSTVVIGKLTGVKVTPKPDDAELAKRPPKPPKPGQQKKSSQELPYTVLRKRTLSDIEDMKRKMELIELGIPLGLICPTSTSEKAMPTKAMPPIKSFLDPAKVDEIISEAKKAKAEGKEFKFDYQKLLPDYDNPFQRKKEDAENVKQAEAEKEHKKMEFDKKKRDKYDRDSRRHSSVRRDDKNKWKDERYRERSRDKSVKRESMSSVDRETNVNLNDYLVCDSWSLDNEDRTNSSSPKRHDIPIPIDKIPIPIKEKPVETIEAKIRQDIDKVTESPKVTNVKKIEKLQPVIDSFKYELDSNDDEMLDLYDDNNIDVEKYPKTNKDFDSTFEKLFESEQFDKDDTNDALTDDTFLEAVINEIKQESISDDEGSHDKGLVEYDSPSRDGSSPKDERISVTPELDDRMRDLQSRRSDYSDGYRSTESGYKSTESGYKSDRSSSYRISTDNELTNQMPKSTVDSLETWSFVLKICQPLLFRHDRNKCYRESRTVPKIWYTVNPKMCSCVKDRAIVYEELETCKMNLVDRVYGCDQILESGFPKARMWYPHLSQFLSESTTVPTVTTCEWEAEDSQTEGLSVKDKSNSYKATRSTTPLKSEEISLDREYQRFMEAVWPDVSETKCGTPRSTTPVKQDVRKKKAEETQKDDKKKAKKLKLSSEGWSQESDIEEESDKIKKVDKISKMDKVKNRKRKHSTTPSISDSDQDSKKRRKTGKKKASKTSKSKLLKRQRHSKKYLKKLKEKHRKKKKQTSEDEDIEKENKKKEKKLKRKKLQKKKKAQKKKKGKVKSSSSSSSLSTSSTESSSDYESDKQSKKKKKKSDAKKKHKHSSSDSTQSEDLFDENILNNIKTERLTDDENKLDFSRHKPREIINVKELQNDFVGSVKIKQEVGDKIIVRDKGIAEDKMILKEKETVEDKKIVKDKEKGFVKTKEIVKDNVVEEKKIECDEFIEKYENIESPTQHSESVSPIAPENDANENCAIIALENIPIPQDTCQFKEPMDMNQFISQEQLQTLPEATQPEESNLSLCSSQDSSISKDPYEKDDSHLRPSSQNSNYSFHDVINASQSYQKDDEDKFEPESYEGNYEMYEQLAMAYQSDVAKGNVESSPGPAGSEWWMSQRIETVVDGRVRGEIKCDWRPGDTPTTAVYNQQRPSRWGLKPGEVNIVLTEGSTEHYPMPTIEPVYQIEILANNRVDTGSTGSYDEAYEDMYGASDRLQYGDCFGTPTPDVVKVLPPANLPPSNKSLTTSSAFEDRIDQALKNTVLGAVAKVSDETDADKETPEKGILVIKPEVRNTKRVSFADGYKPGQDSDVEEPPKRKKKSRRLGSAWPCPASHPDHVPLWDALPPPPPPAGSPPPFITQPSKISQPLLLQQPPPILQQPSMLQRPPPIMQQSPAMMQRPPPLLQSSAILQQQPPSLLQQQPSLLQQQPPPMMQQQQLIQQQLLKSLNPAMLQGSPFAMAPKMDPNVSLPNFMPPEPPPGIISFQ